jgi:hypothetical protein
MDSDETMLFGKAVLAIFQITEMAVKYWIIFHFVVKYW